MCSVHFGLTQNEPKIQGCGMPVGSECRPSDTDWNGPTHVLMVKKDRAGVQSSVVGVSASSL